MSATSTLRAHPTLPPLLVKDVLKETAHTVPGAVRERQGAGALSPGQAVARALSEQHSSAARLQISANASSEGISFLLHDHAATSVHVLGSWNDWSSPGVPARSIEPGFLRTRPLHLLPGKHAYKFLLDGHRWLDDPHNPHKVPDGFGTLNSVAVVLEDSGPRASEDDLQRSKEATTTCD